jgi:hypothetical protein
VCQRLAGSFDLYQHAFLDLSDPDPLLELLLTGAIDFLALNQNSWDVGKKQEGMGPQGNGQAGRRIVRIDVEHVSGGVSCDRRNDGHLVFF